MSDILDKNEIKENLDSLDGWIIKNNLLIAQKTDILNKNTEYAHYIFFAMYKIKYFL